MSRLFTNNKHTIVNDAIDGAIYSNKHNNLLRIDVDPKIRIVSRKDWDKDKVALICGGGSGHEPAHVGYIGRGMLTAAVCGDIFASPSVDAVLNAIVHVTGEKGCLVIVKNYTGDRLNFGLACEKAKEMGLKVEMVIVDDDIAIPDNPQPRGIAGTVLVHKVAGCAAEQGKSLEEVKSIALSTIERTSSIGVANSSCTLPGEEINQRIKPGFAELGLGIHGEPGINTIHLTSCIKTVEIMIEQLRSSLANENSKLAVMINNLGGVSPIEMSVVTKCILESDLQENISLIIGPSAFMTAIDMKGFSITCLELNKETMSSLLTPVEVDAWHEPAIHRGLCVERKEKVPSNLCFIPSKNANVGTIVQTITTTLIKSEQELNRLDSIVGDGDTGSTFSAGASQILNALNNGDLPLDDTGMLLGVIGDELSRVMGGSSGVLLSILFTSAASHYAKSNNLVSALQVGLEQMMMYGGAKVGDCTMIDAIYPALRAWKDNGFSAAIIAAREGAESTASMNTAKAGRSSYLNSDALTGIKDPGSFAVEKVFASLA